MKEEEREEIMLNDSKNFTSQESKDELNQSNSTINIEVKEETKMKKKRMYWVDALRVFANYLVILTHVSLRYDNSKLGSYTWFVNTFYNSAAKVCIPSFVMISGLLFLNPKKELSCKKMYSKYILRIFKSYVFWSFIYNAIDTNLSSYFYNKSKFVLDKSLINETIKKFILGGQHLWYLNFVMGLYAVTPIVKKITPDKPISWYTCILSIIICQFVPNFDKILTGLFEINQFGIIKKYVDGLIIEMLGSYIAYYLLGYLLNVEEFKKKYVYITYFFGFVGLLLTYIFRCAYALHINNSNDFSLLESNMFTISMASIGTFMFFKYTLRPKIDSLVSKYIFFERALIILSDNSFGIYLIHLIINRLFNLILPLNSFEPILCTPITALIVHLICLVVIYYLRKIPLCREVM